MVCCRQKWIPIIKQNLQGSNDQTHHMHPILIWAKGFTLKIQWEAYLYYLFSHALSGDTSHPEEQYVLCKHITDKRLKAFCTQKNKMKAINKSSSAVKQFLFLISDKENIQCPSPPTSCIRLYFGWVWHFQVVLVNSHNENMSHHQQHGTLK